jgi:tRNA pseudouridine55 synthase
MDDFDKEYAAEVILGIETDTLDLDKNATILREEKVDIDDKKIIDVVNSFNGKYVQTVPKYSAVKVNGRKLYEYARSNIPVELPSKEVSIKDISISNIKRKDSKIIFKLKCTVSKGTYIRSLIRDIGKELGIPCVMEELVRTKQGVFSIEDAYSIGDIENGNYEFIPLSKVLEEHFSTIVDSETEKKIKNGAVLPNIYNEDFIVFKNIKDEVVGIYGIYPKDNKKIKPIRVFK